MKADDYMVGGNHYREIPGEQHWSRIWRLYGRGYFVGCITKYCERYHLKNGIQDLEKARHYLDKLIELETEALPKPETEEDVKNRWLEAVGPVKQKIVDTNNDALEIAPPKPEEKKSGA